MSAPVWSRSLPPSDSLYSPRRLPSGSNFGFDDCHNDMNAICSRSLSEEDNESIAIDPSSPASSTCSDREIILRNGARHKGAVLKDQII